MDNFVKQGDKAFKKGEKELKTSVIKLKFKADHLAAVSHYEEAAKLYKSGKANEKAIKAYEKVIMCNEKLEDAWGIARGLEGMVETYLKEPNLIQDDQQIIETTKQAGMYFKAEDAHNNLLKLYIKLAELFIKRGKNGLALSVTKEAFDEAVESEKNYNVSDIMNFYINLLVQNKYYDKAIDVYKQQINILKSKNTKVPLEMYALMAICLCLISDQIIRARTEFNEFVMEVPNFLKTGEYHACNRMLDLHENGEQDEFLKVVRRPPVSLQYPTIIPRLMQKVQTKQMLVEEQAPQNEFQQQKQNLFNIQGTNNNTDNENNINLQDQQIQENQPQEENTQTQLEKMVL